MMLGENFKRSALFLKRIIEIDEQFVRNGMDTFGQLIHRVKPGFVRTSSYNYVRAILRKKKKRR